ncbi:MAG: outer membrane lipoprotein carrier protein LolA [Deltaproteobacteria bacterium]|nr:outer membrane lipoprotein carrier protein LolA [Deltaproteobacteria bacterium]
MRFSPTVKRGVLAVAVLSMIPLLAGWAENWESIRQAMAHVHTVSSDFVQKKNLKILSKPLISEGRFYYRAPGDLRWEYTYPIKNILLVHGGKVAMYVWNKGGFTKDEGPQLEATRIVMEQIASWLNGNFHDNRAFIPELKHGNPTRIVLIPAKNYLAKFIKRITLTLSGTPGVISSIRILEPHGSSTVIGFTHISLNAHISDTTFERIK